MMARIKVAQIITRMDWGGPPDIIRSIYESLVKSGYDMKLITGSTRNPSLATRRFLEKFKDNITVIPWLRREVNPLFDMLALFSLYRILARERYDIVHTHTSKAGALGRIAAYLTGNSRVIHMPHGHVFYGYFNPMTNRAIISIEKFLSALTSRFIALNEKEKQELAEFGVSSADKIIIISSGFDLGFKNIGADKARNKKRQMGFREDQKVVGMVSRLEPVKGAEYFIEAAREISGKNPDAAFIIVGEGSLRNKLEEKVKNSGLDKKITFMGWRDDALDIISFLNILVQPSLNEAVGRVLIEAQGLGVPVVATSVGGIPEVVQDGITGVLVPAGNANKLALAVCGLMNDEGLRRGMSAKAREWVDEKFSDERMAAGIESLYREMMQR